MPPGLTIGKLIAAVKRRGYDVSAPTLRYWGRRGLIHPERTASGYRTYRQADIDRVALICRLQSERHMPLVSIADYLEALDRGLEPDLPENALPKPPPTRGAESPTGAVSELRLTASELRNSAGIGEDLFSSLQSYGLLSDSEYFDRGDAEIAAAAGLLADRGIEPRHLRQFSAAAERELALVDAVMAPAARTNTGTYRAEHIADDEDAVDRARDIDDQAHELASACGRLHAALLLAKLPGRYR